MQASLESIFDITCPFPLRLFFPPQVYGEIILSLLIYGACTPISARRMFMDVVWWWSIVDMGFTKYPLRIYISVVMNACTLDVGGNWGFISWAVATFNHVGVCLILSSATAKDVRTILSFRFWGCVLHVEHIWCVITSWGQRQWVIPSLFPLTLSEYSIPILWFVFRILLFHNAFLIFWAILLISAYFLFVGLLL